jgi:archaellum component FlaC
MADTQVQTRNPKDQAIEAVAEIQARPLSATESAEVEKTFAEAKDFRSLGEKITAPIDSIISETATIIDSDPIMNVSDQLTEMNNNVQSVYKEIINNDGTVMKIAKTIPILGGLMKSLDAKWDEAAFNVKSLEGKIQMIFSGFDQAYNSLNTSVDMQKKFLEGIDENLGKVVAYKEFLGAKIEEFKAK